MRLIVFGDTHLKHAGADVDASNVSFPERTDAVMLAGNLVDDPPPGNIAEGRSFL